jgi:hypothetical protein
MNKPEALTLASDMPAVIHSLLHYTPEDAAVSYVYRQRDDALTAARNAAEAHAADLRRADYIGGPPAPFIYPATQVLLAALPAETFLCSSFI